MYGKDNAKQTKVPSCHCGSLKLEKENERLNGDKKLFRSNSKGKFFRKKLYD